MAGKNIFLYKNLVVRKYIHIFAAEISKKGNPKT